MIGCLLGLAAAVSLLAAGIGHPLRDAVNVVSWLLVLAFVVSFVMAAVSSFGFRRAAKAESVVGPAQPKAPMSTHDRIVYIVAFVSGTAVGLVYIGSFGSVPWAWPAFVMISLTIVGIVLLIRR
jgi:Na+-transporting methylmalonyl-CoA/oxaloacetate decarboxylase gamma subunit